MTIFAKKKECTGKNKDSTSKSCTATVSNNSTPAPVANSENDGNVTGREPSEPHPHLPAFDSQPEEKALRSMPELRSTKSVSSAWPHSQGLPHSIVNNSEKRATSHYDYHKDTGSSNLGKRRLRLSPLRTRTKHSRVDRDRSNSSTPSTCTVVSSGYVGSPSSPVEPAATIPTMPLPSSPERNACNSEDEHEAKPSVLLTEEEWEDRERRFEKKLRKKGFRIKQMGEDGACLFRAVADQVYGDQDMHDMVRKHCMDYIAANHDYYSPYVTEDFKNYVSRKRLDNCHGNHIEIQAMCEMYNRTIEVYCYSSEPINAFHGVHKTDNAPIRLSYHREIHYNSIVDPYAATIGVGLGLPGYNPGLADKNILSEAARQSEKFQIEQAMLEDKLRATDWDATNEAIEEQVSRESYLQWLKDNERRNRTSVSYINLPNLIPVPSSSATVSSSSLSDIRPPRSRSIGTGNLSPLGSPYRNDLRNSPSRHSPPPSIPGPSSRIGTSTISDQSSQFQSLGVSSGPIESTGFGFSKPVNSPLYDMSEWDDAGILAQVLAASQQEYFDNLKRNHESLSLQTGNNDSITGGGHLGGSNSPTPVAVENHE